MAVINSPAVRAAVEVEFDRVKGELARDSRIIHVTSTALNEDTKFGVGIGVITFTDGDHNFTVFSFRQADGEPEDFSIFDVWRFSPNDIGHIQAIRKFTALENGLHTIGTP